MAKKASSRGRAGGRGKAVKKAVRKRAPKRAAAAPAVAGGRMQLDRLEQVRVLATPLRMQLLEAFASEPRTTKQVAESLGEKPTRLYHHVDAMRRVGLIKLVRTRQNRGALEKYFQTVAHRFEVSSELYRALGPSAGETESLAMIRTIYETAGKEMTAFFNHPDRHKSPVSPLIGHARIEAPRKKLESIHADLSEVIARCEQAAGVAKPAGRKSRRAAAPPAAGRKGSDPDERAQYVLTVFYHPIMKAKK